MSVLNNILRQSSNAAKFGAVSSDTLYSYQGRGASVNINAPSASAFINELKAKGFKNVLFSLQVESSPLGANLPKMYQFYGTLSSSTMNLNEVKAFLQGYFNYYFSNPSINVQQQTNLITASGSATGVIERDLSIVLSGNTSSSIVNFAPASYIDFNYLKTQLTNNGWKNLNISKTSPETIRVKGAIPNNLTDAQAENVIRQMCQIMLNSAASSPSIATQVSNTIRNANNQVNNATLPVYNQGATIAQTILSAAQSHATATGKTLDEAVKTVTNGVYATAEAVGKDASKLSNSFDFNSILNSKWLTTLAASLGIGTGVTLLVSAAMTAVFLKVFLSSK